MDKLSFSQHGGGRRFKTDFDDKSKPPDIEINDLSQSGNKFVMRKKSDKEIR